MKKNDLLRRKLQDLKTSLPAQILEDHFILRPDMAMQYSEHQKENFQKDVVWILSFLSEAAWAGQPILFEEFTSWLKSFLKSVNVPMKDVAESFELIKKRLNSALLPQESEIINPILDKSIRMILSDESQLSIPANENFLTPLAQEYLDYLLRAGRDKALTLILDEVQKGGSIKEIYMHVFHPVQYEIGRLWQLNKISVAQEHYCTGATQLVMSQLYPYLFTGEKKSKKMVTTCVSGELHEMGARMVTDFFEMEGWDTYYLGANMPVEGVIRYLSDVKPQFLAISATMTFHVNQVEDMIRRIRLTTAISPDLKIMVGGYPFIVSDSLWQTVGADGFAANALDAIQLADNLILAS